MITILTDETSAVDLDDLENFSRDETSKKKYGLVVEDQSIARLIAKTFFVEQGCEIDLVENGSSAVTQVQNRHYHFILMDIGLPDINGYEVTKAIRSFEKASGRHRSFIVGLTCHAGDKKQHALDVGMNIILNKPLTKEMTADILENFIFNENNIESAA